MQYNTSYIVNRLLYNYIKHNSILQVYLLDCGDAKASAKLVRAREAGTEYYVEHCGDLFYVLTNYPNGGNYQVRRSSIRVHIQID